MTVTTSIDPALPWAEQIDRAEPDLLRALLKTFVEALMGAEADAICGAPYGSRSQQRVNSRNGYRAGRIHPHLPHVGRRPLVLGGVRAHAVADVTAYRCWSRRRHGGDRRLRGQRSFRSLGVGAHSPIPWAAGGASPHGARSHRERSAR
jgi:hypothetical protein